MSILQPGSCATGRRPKRNGIDDFGESTAAQSRLPELPLQIECGFEDRSKSIAQSKVEVIAEFAFNGFHHRLFREE